MRTSAGALPGSFSANTEQWSCAPEPVLALEATAPVLAAIVAAIEELPPPPLLAASLGEFAPHDTKLAAITAATTSERRQYELDECNDFSPSARKDTRADRAGRLERHLR
jgi:hypothetical protein